MLFIVLFAAQCSNPPGREGLPTVYHPVPTLQWTAQGQGHHTGQEVSTHKENTKHSSKTCIPVLLCTSETSSFMLVLYLLSTINFVPLNINFRYMYIEEFYSIRHLSHVNFLLSTVGPMPAPTSSTLRRDLIKRRQLY